MLFPELKPVLKGISKLWAGVALNFSDKYVLPVYSLFSKIYQILDTRIETKTKKQDYLQILLDAYDESLTNETDKDAILDVSSMKIEKKLSGDVSTDTAEFFVSVRYLNLTLFFKNYKGNQSQLGFVFIGGL